MLKYQQAEEERVQKDAITFSELIRIVTKKMCAKIDEKKTIYVTDFVNIKNFKNKSQLGFLLSSELKVSLFSNCSDNLQIKELEFRDSVKLGQHGINVLSRTPKALKAKYILKNHQVLVGTYSITRKQLIIYLKLIDFDSGNTLVSSRANIKLDDEIKDLEGVLKPNPKYVPKQKPRVIL
jgi:TolB-like protein